MKLADQPTPTPITPQQVQEARRLLGWSRDRLAMQSETIVGLVANFEDTGRVAKMLYYPENFDALVPSAPHSSTPASPSPTGTARVCGCRNLKRELK